MDACGALLEVPGCRGVWTDWWGLSLINFGFFFVVEEVIAAVGALCCAVLFWLLGVFAVAAQEMFVADAGNRQNDAQQPTIQL